MNYNWFIHFSGNIIIFTHTIKRMVVISTNLHRARCTSTVIIQLIVEYLFKYRAQYELALDLRIIQLFHSPIVVILHSASTIK